LIPSTTKAEKERRKEEGREEREGEGREGRKKKGREICLAHSFRRFRPWSAGCIVLGPVARQSIMARSEGYSTPQ
jgi:hypothetical protein